MLCQFTTKILICLHDHSQERAKPAVVYCYVYCMSNSVNDSRNLAQQATKRNLQSFILEKTAKMENLSHRPTMYIV